MGQTCKTNHIILFKINDLAKYLFIIVLLLIFSSKTSAHPLGNFTINHFARIEIGEASLNIRYIVDMAEVPTFQELQPILTSKDGSMSLVERRNYIDKIAPIYVNAIVLRVDGVSIPLAIERKNIDLLPGESKLKTLRLEFDLKGDLSTFNPKLIHKLTFEDTNHTGRLGWHEVVISPLQDISVFNSSAFGNALSDELLEFPENTKLSLNERKAELSFTKGITPAGSTPLLMRNQVSSNLQNKSTDTHAPTLRWFVILGLVVVVVFSGFYVYLRKINL